jgi:RNA polymerase sigma-70 factor (ECF subfamily)
LTPEQEKLIIEQVALGETDAFEELLLANQKNVYNLALKMTGNQTDAEDITQEAFFKAFRLLSSFRGDSRFSVWLYRITHNLCIDFLRKKKKTPTVPLLKSDADGEEVVADIPDEGETPESSAIRRELSETINKSIDELETLQREIIIMREITGMSYSDISKTLNISEGTVKSRLSRARKTLADILTSKSIGTFPSEIRQTEGRSDT